MKIFIIVILMIAITLLRLVVPNGISIGLLYAIPIYLSAPLRIWKIFIPALAVILSFSSVIFGDGQFFGDHYIAMLVDKSLTAGTLVVLAYMASFTYRKHTLELKDLHDINDDLKRRIDRYN